MSYFNDIQAGIRTTLKGLSLTFRHLRNATKRRTPQGIASDNYFDLQNGLVTLQYPYEQLPIPDNGRYRLRNEIDDCIVCDKCAKVCPVDCITIDAIKATEEVGRASDGSPIRLYAAKFDIDMAKCCYCGLCTVVCPTECLTMDKKFDYSEFELGKLTYNFSNLTPEQADEKRSLYEQFLQEKEASKAAKSAASAPPAEPSAKPPAGPARPVFRPTAKPVAKTPPAEPANSEGSSIEHPLTDATPEEMQQIAQGGLEVKKHPVFKPTQKPAAPLADVASEEKIEEQVPTADVPMETKPNAKPPGFRPSMKPNAAGIAKSVPAASDANLMQEKAEEQVSTPGVKPAGFRPTMKPPVKEPDISPVAEPPKAKPAFRPTMKPPIAKSEELQSDVPVIPEASVPKPVAFRPTMKPAKSAESPLNEPSKAAESETPKPVAFRPTMKPAPRAPDEEKNQTDPESLLSSTTEADQKTEAPVVEIPKPKPAGFRPTMKPKPKSDDGQSA